MDAPTIPVESESQENPAETTEPEIKSTAAASGTLPNQNNSPNDRENDDEGSKEQGDPAAEEKPLSKNQQRKLKRQQRWEDDKEDRKRRRKEKRQDQKARKREQREERVAEAVAAGIDPSSLFKKPPKVAAVNVPIALIIDCDFEQYMRDSEIVSLGSQITRCYSDNRLGPYRTHLYVSSWQRKLRDRFRDVLEDVQKNWKGIQFLEDDFEAAAAQAMERFGSGQGGTVIDRIKPNETPEPKVEESHGQLPDAIVEVAPADAKPHIIYLSSESEHTLERLEANTCYVIGGLVDRNREKGLCHKRATERGLRTARLPIGQYMMLQSRQVLATNHVVEIMLRWLECGDWGEAFLKVIPKRKGVQLRTPVDAASGSPPDLNGCAGALGEEEDSQPNDEDATEEEDEAPEVDEEAKEGNLRRDLTEASTKF